MNINYKKLALIAVLGLTATGCQKENVLPLSGNEQTMETIQVVYSINGEVFQTTLSESEWDAFLERMMALAREGYEISFSKNRSSLTSQSKEIVTFVTTSEQKAHAWSNEMLNQGYKVTISYNHKTGEYTCIATR
jgi:hypothetical protein